jgi:hypothetical protein
VSKLLRANALTAAAIGAGLAALSWLSLYGFAWNDYDVEASTAVRALTEGHVASFLALAPAYGGSLVLRAPFALLPGLWHGGDLAVYRMIALPCLLAAGALGMWLAARMRAMGHGPLARVTALSLCAASPIMMRALELGHAEEILAAVLCVSAVLVARSGRAGWAGLLLGLAIATKAWTLLAVLPVLCALPAHHWRVLTIAVAVAALVLAPLFLSHSHTAAGGGAVATQTGAIFQPWQAWWWLGAHGEVVRGLGGQIKPGYRTAPGWISGITHPLIILLAVPLTMLWLRRRASRALEPLGLLTLLLLMRCVLDPWNNVYYSLGFLFALLVWEVLSRPRPPLLTLGSTVLVWVTFQELPGRVGADAQSAAYLAWSLPLLAMIAVWLYAPRAWARMRAATTPRHAAAPPGPIQPRPRAPIESV